MIHFLQERATSNGRLSRREWLRIGTMSSLLGLNPLGAKSRSSADYPGFGKAKSVILVYASGGQSQIDLWDMKPNAPVEVRGAFRPARTSVPGTMIVEHLPRIAKLAHLFTLVRNVSHDDLDHGSASYVALTGRFHPRKSSNPPPRPTDYPTYGAILHRQRPSKDLPFSAVHVNGPAQVPEIQAPGQFGGFLGRAYEPLLLGDVTREQIALDGLQPLANVSPKRINDRRSLLHAVESTCEHLERNPAMLKMRTSFEKAYDLLASQKCRRALDLSREPKKVRQRYGMHRSGQACLMARRLVEIGVPWITVIWNHSNRGQDKAPGKTDLYGWDTHNDIFEALKVHLMPRFDESFSALLEDLHQRGLLDTTLVVCMGEFGRAPKVALETNFAGTSPGRKHWASAYSIVAAGAGVGRGTIVGATDRMGAYVEGEAVAPGDVAATMFSSLGVDPAQHFVDSNDRPHVIATGKPIAGWYG